MLAFCWQQARCVTTDAFLENDNDRDVGKFPNAGIYISDYVNINALN